VVYEEHRTLKCLVGHFRKFSHGSHWRREGESWVQSRRNFWIAWEVTKSWVKSLRNEWLIIKWLIIYFFFFSFYPSDSSFPIFFPQIDPKVAFPRRAQPKVSWRASHRVLALKDGCKDFTFQTERWQWTVKTWCVPCLHGVSVRWWRSRWAFCEVPMPELSKFDP
jgi:hypothetical protein